ncbi:MAG: hypothetical protein WCR56_00120 [Bacilli bacterium]
MIINITYTKESYWTNSFVFTLEDKTVIATALIESQRQKGQVVYKGQDYYEIKPKDGILSCNLMVLDSTGKEVLSIANSPKLLCDECYFCLPMNWKIVGDVELEFAFDIFDESNKTIASVKIQNLFFKRNGFFFVDVKDDANVFDCLLIVSALLVNSSF